jgi:hypothetical protein
LVLNNRYDALFSPMSLRGAALTEVAIKVTKQRCVTQHGMFTPLASGTIAPDLPIHPAPADFHVVELFALTK